MINKIPGARPDQRLKVWTVIHKMYENVMSFVRINSDGVVEDSSDYEVRHGLREGSFLSPTLFAIFINDLIQKLEEADVECVLEGIDLRGILYADDIALIADSAADLQKLINKAGEYADINQYQFSYKNSKYIVFGNDATPKLKDLKILLSANDQSKKAVRMKHTDRYTYLGLELHEMLGAYDHICDEAFEAKREYLNKVFIDPDCPEEGPKIIIRIQSDINSNRVVQFQGIAVPFEAFEKSKRDLFEELDPEIDDHREYWLHPSLEKDIQNYEKQSVVKPRSVRYPVRGLGSPN